MPNGYHHLTYEQRCQISTLLKRNFSEFQIAIDLQVHQSTINREIKRNKGKKGYRFKQAQELAEKRRYKASSNQRKMIPEMTILIEEILISRQWSPEQISGRIKKEKGISISHERIYQHIWNDKKMAGYSTSNYDAAVKNIIEDVTKPRVEA